MINIPMKSKGAIDRSTLHTLNKKPAPSQKNAKKPVQRQIPPLVKPVQKGQKVSIETSSPLRSIKA